MKHRAWWLGAAALIVLLLGWVWLSYRSAPPSAETHKQRAAVQVEIAVAARQDVPVYLEGLGNVQAF